MAFNKRLRLAPRITTTMLADLERANNWLQANHEALTDMMRDKDLREELTQLAGNLFSMVEVLEDELAAEEMRRAVNSGAYTTAE